MIEQSLLCPSCAEKWKTVSSSSFVAVSPAEAHQILAHAHRTACSPNMPTGAHLPALMLVLVTASDAFYPDPVGLGINGLGAKGPMRGKPGRPRADHGTPEMAMWLVIPFVLIVIFVIALMIWLIISDEKADAKKREDEKRARSLKFGRMDPRYHRD